MAEETTTSDTQDATLNASDPTTETVTATESDATLETTTTTEQQSTDERDAQIRRLEAAVKKANKEDKDRRLENAELKKQHAELLKFKEQIETEKLSETEKQQAARQKLEKQLADIQAERDKAALQVQELKINQDIFAKAAKVGINPTLAAKVLDHSELDFDDKGNPTNVEDLLKDLLKEYPNLATATNNARQSATSSAGGATNPSRTQTSMPTQLTWEYVNKITKSPEEYNKLSREHQRSIAQWISENQGRR
jgi:hypothetical protein